MRDGLARSFDKEALVVLLLPGRAKWETMKFLDRHLDFATFHNRTAERGLNLPRMLPAKHRKVNQIREPGCYELLKHQTLLGVTGSGKTFTVANVIRNIGKPTLVISHNKTLAAQLYAEFKGFFPENAVEYFVSYFDYYQPEAYIPRTDTFIEKDSSINDDIERMRLSTMSSLFARRDVVVVASVSCIYGIGSKEDYEAM